MASPGGTSFELPVPPGLLGMYVAGDLADTTWYTKRSGRQVLFGKAPPTTPPSAGQIRQRARFRWAQKQWSLLDGATKAMWENAMRTLGIVMTGQNAYISQSLLPDPAALATINQRAKTNLQQPQQAPG